MSDTVTPVSTPESPSENWEQVPNPEGEESADGSEETGLYAGGASPGLDAEPPGQQTETPPTETPPAEQAKAPEQQATEPTQQLIPAKEDESRFEYWQSKANQNQRKLDEIEGSQIHTIAKHIQKTPDLLEVVEESLRGGPVTRPKGIPERPIRPQRPDNYDSSEAHDPETVSGRYRASYNDYQEKKDIFNDAREEQAEISTRRNAETARLAGVRSGLIRDGGLNELEADDAMVKLFSSESMNPVTLAKFYKTLIAPSQDEIANQEKAKQLLARKPGLETPPPLAKAPGEAPLPTTDEDDYHSAMAAQAELGGSLL